MKTPTITAPWVRGGAPEGAQLVVATNLDAPAVDIRSNGYAEIRRDADRKPLAELDAIAAEMRVQLLSGLLDMAASALRLLEVEGCLPVGVVLTGDFQRGE